MPHLLVIAEHSQGSIKAATGSAAGFAEQVVAASGGTFEILVIGSGVDAVAAAATRLGASAVLLAEAPLLEHPRADSYAQVIADVARERGATLLVAATSTFSKDILPRAAALLDASMLSDVIGVRVEEGALVCRRVMFAGNAIGTIRLAGAVGAVTVRPAAFTAPNASSAAPVIPIPIGEMPTLIRYMGREGKLLSRPDPTEARIVVSGGRALRTSEDFERLVGGLADALGAAVGSSRALVDSGVTPNNLQIGQTGKNVSPELYIAVGISGAIQHLAGMKDAKIIVAINKDGDAPIFEVADYGLVADVYVAVPEMIDRLKSRTQP